MVVVVVSPEVEFGRSGAKTIPAALMEQFALILTDMIRLSNA